MPANTNLDKAAAVVIEHDAEHHHRGEAKFRRLAGLSRSPNIAKIHASFADYHALKIKRRTAQQDTAAKLGTPTQTQAEDIREA